MRIVAGIAKGRPLAAPGGRNTRPTTDRVREAVFSSLTSLGAVAGARVVDLFAGTGALGLEALSRGAESAVFVESDARVWPVLEANIAKVGLGGQVVRTDVVRFLDTPHEFDLAFADPPYAFDGWPELLERLNTGVAVLESDREVALDGDPEPAWEILRVRRYGSTVVTVARRLAPP